MKKQTDLIKYMDDWCFVISGYKAPLPGVKPIGDWLEGGINLKNPNKEIFFQLQHLFMEELEDFFNWLGSLDNSTSNPAFFQFMDTPLCFEFCFVSDTPVLRLNYEDEGQVSAIVDLSAQKDSGLVKQKMQHIQSLLLLYPCRCHQIHDVFKN